MEATSFFEEQSKRQWQTLFFVLLGIIWMTIMGFLMVIVNVDFLQDVMDLEGLGYINIRSASIWGMVAAVSLWVLITIILYLSSQSVIPGIVGAKRAGGDDLKVLAALGDEMALACGESFSPSSFYVLDSPAQNAMACGRSLKKGSIVVTRGLLDKLSREELQAVIAHEMAHLKNGDSWYTVQAVGFVWAVLTAGIAAGLAVFLALAILSLVGWIISKFGEEAEGAGGCLVAIIGLVLLFYGLFLVGIYVLLVGLVLIIVSIGVKAASSSVSKAREFLADACSAQWTRNPLALASALAKIESGPALGGLAISTLRPLWLGGQTVAAEGFGGKIINFLYKTHPPLDVRLERLRAMAGSTAVTDGRWLLDLKVSFWSKAKTWLLVFLATVLAAGISLGIWRLCDSRGASYQKAQIKPPEAQVQVKEVQEEKIIYGVINKPVVNVRQAPDLKAPVLFQLSQGSVVKITGRQAGWYAVEWEAAGQVRKGWVADWLITIKSNQVGK